MKNLTPLPFSNFYYIFVTLLMVLFITINKMIWQSYVGVPTMKGKEISALILW